MKNLSKEAFWNEMEEVCPKAVALFFGWIDEYKEIVGWEKLFAEGVKFHHIPYELQMGIMNRFFIESFANREEYFHDGKRTDAYHREMKQALQTLEKRLISAKN